MIALVQQALDSAQDCSVSCLEKAVKTADLGLLLGNSYRDQLTLAAHLLSETVNKRRCSTVELFLSVYKYTGFSKDSKVKDLMQRNLSRGQDVGAQVIWIQLKLLNLYYLSPVPLLFLSSL